jgi:deazaflavin-dependent oxidoreductase (nitroreductase family)
MSTEPGPFERPNASERIFNRWWGMLVSGGIGFRHSFQLEVRGRTTGRTYSTPVSLLDHAGKHFLVAPRGRTQWVRNAWASGEVTLRKGRKRRRFRLREVPDGEKPEVLKAYLDRFERSVQRYFPVRAGSPVEEFVSLAARYPVFQAIRESSQP